jgi:hypothetical protein
MDEPSESIGVMILLIFTILPLFLLGIGVLIGAGQEVPPDEANLQFEKIGGSLLITYSSPYEHTAGDVYLRGSEGNVTWAQLTNKTAAGDPIPDTQRVEMGESSAYGHNVQEGEAIEVIYKENGQEYTLGRYGESSGPGDNVDLPDNPTG